METQRLPHRHSISGRRVQHMFLSEFLHLGQTFEWCGAIQHDAFATLSLVWHLSAIGLLRLLFRIQKTSVPASSAYEHDTQTGAHTTLVYESHVMVSDISTLLFCESPHKPQNYAIFEFIAAQ